MKNLVIFLFGILVSLPIEAQIALKGGISCTKDELSSYVVTGQFYQDLLVVSGDLLIPAHKNEKLSGGDRIGIGLGGNRARFVADIGATYENEEFRFGYGSELNLLLLGPIGMFVRWSQTHPIPNDDEYKVDLWKYRRSEVSVGIVIDLTNGSHY